MPELIRPPKLAPGATVGVAALSGPVDPAALDAGIARLRSLGYRVRESSNLRASNGFLAGSDSERVQGYRNLLQDPEISAIFFARGGHGATRVLSRLDPAEARVNPKIHLGGSDLTALFARLLAAGLPAFYGPMVAIEIAREDGLDWEPVLRGEPVVEHAFSPGDVVVPGRGEGPLAGGCLSLLASLCGTPDAVRADGSVLFWEDIGEEIYRIDRMLTQLERSGTFDRIQAMVVGSVVSRDRADPPENVREYLRDRFRGGPFPVAVGLPAGHLRRPRTLPIGATAALILDESPRLRFGPTPLA